MTTDSGTNRLQIDVPVDDSSHPRRCIVCHHRELAAAEPQTCRRCVTVTRSAVTDIVGLAALLSAELRGRVGAAAAGGGAGGDENPLPMAELLSLMGPGGDGYGERSDTPSVAWSLASWEDAWRDFGGFGGSPYPATVERAAEWLTANLGTMAQRHPAFDEFAGDMRSLRFTLLRALRMSDDPVRMNADCFECGEPLVRDYVSPSPCRHSGEHTSLCDQGGLRDYCRCTGCGRVYTPAQYRLALRAAIEMANEGAA